MNQVDIAIESIIDACNLETHQEKEALRSSLYDKLDYRVGNFLDIDNADLYALSDAELGSLTRDVLCAVEDVACEGFTAHEIAALNKMLREFMLYYKGCKEDGRMEMIKGWAKQREVT